MIRFLADNPLLILFVVMAVGAGVGALNIGGASLGPAAALFAGLAIGAIDDRLTRPPVLAGLQTLGLVLFTYTIGLASGPTFVAGLRRAGARIVVVTVGLVGVLAGLCALAAEVLDVGAADRAGLFAGATTSTPALQAAIDKLGTAAGNPVVAYSLTYPSAVIAMLVGTSVLLRGPRRRRGESDAVVAAAPSKELVNWTVRIDRSDLPALGHLRSLDGDPLTFSRFEHDGHVDVATNEVQLVPGDLVVVVGTETVVARFAAYAGRRDDHHLALDRRSIDMRRVVVSDRSLAGQRLRDLDLPGRFGAAVTRVRRGDLDLVATDDMVLQLGDRVRVVAPVDRLPAVAKALGDSDRSLSELDALGFAGGIAAGLLLGALTLPLPGGVKLELGAGGGPLIAGLVLGFRSRLGPVTFQAPQAANLVLRQLGVTMFLAAAGLRSGSTFAHAVGTRTGAELAAAGVVVAGVFAAFVALAARFALRQDAPDASGTLAGIETQPAALAYAAARTGGDERVVAAYALTFPLAIITKIIVVQFLT